MGTDLVAERRRVAAALHVELQLHLHALHLLHLVMHLLLHLLLHLQLLPMDNVGSTLVWVGTHRVLREAGARNAHLDL